MQTGAAVLIRKGVRGDVVTIRYYDATGKLVRERLGTRREGWTKRKAQAHLRARVVAVQKEGYAKPPPLTFRSFISGWVDQHCDARGLKRSTRHSYQTLLDVHLLPVFGSMKLEEITVEVIERHLDKQRKKGVAPATLHRQLAILSLVFRAAARRDLVRDNPVPLVERPKGVRRRWRILSPVEVGEVERAFDALIAAAEEGRDRDDLLTARVFFMTLMGTGIRRGEALGLRWHSVKLADPDGPTLRVEETWVRAGIDTPKSQAGTRTIALGPRLAGELLDHRLRSPFDGEDERVFPNGRTGNALDVTRYGELFRLALSKASIEGHIRPCHDLRHASITNSAAAGTRPEALMARAGHSDYATTRRYVDLAGERFRDDADLLEQRLGWVTEPAA